LNKTLLTMNGLTLAKLFRAFSPMSNPSFGPSPTPTRAFSESPTPTPTLSPNGHPKINHLIAILCTVMLVLFFCVWYLRRRYMAKRRIKTKRNSKVVTEERKRISGHSTPVSSSHYLNPLTKKSTVPADGEYFFLNSTSSK